MTQLLTFDNLGCVATCSNCISDGLQIIHIVNGMPSHRGFSIIKNNLRNTICFFSTRKLVFSDWKNHDDVYFIPSKIEKDT